MRSGVNTAESVCRARQAPSPPGINERGDIVGVYANTLDDCFAFQAHGFLLRDGQFIALDYPGSQYTETFGLNDDGVIVGDFTDRKSVHHGFKAVPVSSHQ